MIDTPKRCIIVIIYKKGDIDIMKNKNDIQEFSYNVLSRTYTIKVYGQKKDFEKNLNAPCYALTSLFVEDSKKSPSNKQPLNKEEVAFRKNSDIEKIIATLALNYDPDVANDHTLQSALSNKVADVLSDIPDNNNGGVLPDLS